jgi:hypothetical protein
VAAFSDGSRRFILVVVWACLAFALGTEGRSAEPIALEVLEPPQRRQAVRDFPVSVGLVFPEGELRSVPGGAVIDDRGQPVAVEAEATGWWSAQKQSVKWLLLHFRASAGRKYSFVPGRPILHSVGPPLAVQESGAIVVATGPLSVRISRQNSRPFEEVRLNGRPALGPQTGELVLVADDGKRQIPATLSNWSATLEESTPQRASVKCRGFYRDPQGAALARLDLRLHFFRGESFVRLYHTLTWMVKDCTVGAREMAIRLRPAIAQEARLRLGLSDYSPESLDTALGQAASCYAHQTDPETFTIHQDGQVLRQGTQLGGWAAVQDRDGHGLGVAVREPWQMFPLAFSWHKGALAVELVPSHGPRMGLAPEDLMPPDFYHDARYWNNFKWVQGKGHFVHEFSQVPGFCHTAEGAARTHELTLFFYDKTSRRTIDELNSLTQHPLVVRQEPRSALRVPWMGFQIEPVNQEAFPDLERAVEQVGRMALARWPQLHDYGLWRYGMIRWGNTGLSYRWFDGHQYDSQLIPWLLFMRGGDRRWFEEGEATARFAMDVTTNHFNSRGSLIGYQSGAAAMPFPFAPMYMSKCCKVHYLAYYYHLTGYRRAREVMEEVLQGNREAALPKPPSPRPPYWRGAARELFNMNTFWPNAFEETFDPQYARFAREWADLSIHREYDPQLHVFRQPAVYVYNGLILQHQLLKDAALKEVMLQNLAAGGYPGLDEGGVSRCEDAIACDWALRETNDRRFVQVAWDIARTLSDLVPDHDWSSRKAPVYPLWGNQAYRHYLMPILVGYSLGARHGMKTADPFAMRDTFISLPSARPNRMEGEVFLRPRRDGPLKVRLIFSSPAADLSAEARDAAGRRIAAVAIPEAKEPEVKDRFYPYNFFTVQRGEITIPATRKGQTVKLILRGRQPNPVPTVLVLADADLVQRVGLSSLVMFYNLAGQYYVGTRIFTRSTSDEISITNPFNQPFTIRDAATGELLHRYSMDRDIPSLTVFRVGKGRLLQITMTGRTEGRSFKGVSPYLARKREEWFDPEAAGTPSQP